MKLHIVLENGDSHIVDNARIVHVDEYVKVIEEKDAVELSSANYNDKYPKLKVTFKKGV
jgi:hypothetical protein